jgi:hypothetical protein
MSTAHYNNIPTEYNRISIARHHNGDQTRGLFRAAKEFVRFVFTTIVVVESSKCTANAASIIANYHKTSTTHNNNSNTGGRSSGNHKSSGSSSSNNKYSKSGNVVFGGNHEHLNLWHFRTFSTCDAVKTSSFEDPVARGGTVRRRSAVFRSRHRKDVNDDTDTEHHHRATMTSARSVDSIHDDDYENNPFEDPDYQPTVAEMKAQLGPIGLLIANSVEVGITTAGSYLSGGIFGYLIGGAMGVPGIFRNAQEGASAQGALANRSHTHNGMKEFQRRIGDWNGKALAQGKSWAGLSASFSGFHALTRVCRGGVEDKWNSIIGSAATGAYLSRQGTHSNISMIRMKKQCIYLYFLTFTCIMRIGGPQAMLQAAGSYASFTYILDMLFSSGDKKVNVNGGEFNFRDQPISPESRGY